MKVENLQTKNQLNFENFKNSSIKKKITFSFFHFFTIFSFFFSCSMHMVREFEKEGGGRDREGASPLLSQSVSRGKNLFPPAGHPSPSGPPQHPHGTRKKRMNQQQKIEKNESFLEKFYFHMNNIKKARNTLSHTYFNPLLK